MTEFLEGRSRPAGLSRTTREAIGTDTAVRRLTLSSGTVQLRRPRVRNTEESSRAGCCRCSSTGPGRLLADPPVVPTWPFRFDLAVRGLLGEEAPISASTVARLKDKWNDELAQWRARQDDLEVVYMWVDGVYVKAGLEREKAAILVGPERRKEGGGERDSRIQGVHRELVRCAHMRRRGLECPRVIGDGHLGGELCATSILRRPSNVLEPQDPKRTGQLPKRRTRPNSCCVPPLRPDSDRG